MPAAPLPFRFVLFDMDGTLVDSAADLAASVNAMRARRGLAGLPASAYGPAASVGSAALLKIGFGTGPEAPEFPALREEFFAEYEKRCGLSPALFPGIPEALAAIDGLGLPWGVVTNKPQAFAEKIAAAAPAVSRCRAIVGARPGLAAKPAPDGIREGLRLLGGEAKGALYCGDDLRDLQAARAAGTMAAFARWGYWDGPEALLAPLAPDYDLERPASLLKVFSPV